MPIPQAVVSKVKNTVLLLGRIFTSRSPHLNRSYALSLSWALLQTLETYSIGDEDLPRIRENFENIDNDRVEAMARDYANRPGDEIYEDLSLSMSRGTDGLEGISTRHRILPQFLFRGVMLVPRPTLDPHRDFTYEEKLILYRRADGRCQLEFNGKQCGRVIEFDDATVDHITPYSKGGRTELGNGRIAHRSCNIARGARDDFDPATMCNWLSATGAQSQ